MHIAAMPKAHVSYKAYFLKNNTWKGYFYDNKIIIAFLSPMREGGVFFSVS